MCGLNFYVSDVKKMEFNKIHFVSIQNWNFADYTGRKNQLDLDYKNGSQFFYKFQNPDHSGQGAAQCGGGKRVCVLIYYLQSSNSLSNG